MNKYTLIDLFAGIGGIRKGFESAGYFETVFANDNDKHACDVYDLNFPKGPPINREDIWTVLDENSLPLRFDMLVAGFPCQAFSMAGSRNGFEDERGTLFFAIEKILHKYRPKVFLLENVKHLVNHDNKKTFQIIKDILEVKLEYNVSYAVLNSLNFGVPQNRERIYIVGFSDRKAKSRFDFIDFTNRKKASKGIGPLLDETVSDKYYLSHKYLTGLKNHRKRHEEKGHGFGFNILSKKDNAFALVCGGMGRERNLVRGKKPVNDFILRGSKQVKLNSEYIRKLTATECARLQGFPKSFKLNIPDTQAYKLISNAVTIPVIREIAKKVYSALECE